MEHFTETSCRALTTQDCAPHLDDDDGDDELAMVRSESGEFMPKISGIGCLKTALLEVESHLAPLHCDNYMLNGAKKKFKCYRGAKEFSLYL